jgi:hypothetical protein
MRQIVYLTATAPTELAESLTLAGYTVWEALSVSETLYLCEHNPIDLVISAPNLEDPDLVEVQLHRATMKLKHNATTADVVWELSNLFQDGSAREN